jgi:transcriptional regulator with XRE-family HTH domain
MSKLYALQNLIDKSEYKAYVISEKLGHNKSNIYHWLNGENEPCAKDMLKLAKILNVSVETIVRIFGECER